MKKNTQQSGFSLVETLVAITILLLVIIGPLSITTSAVRSTSFSNQQIVASFLAQEGLELAQKARDDVFIDHYRGASFSPGPTAWRQFTRTTPSGAENYRVCFISINQLGCGLEMSNTGVLSTPIDCSIASCLLRLNPIVGTVVRSRYTHVLVLDPNPIYTRRIRFESISTNEIKVTSTVTWRTGSLRQEQSVVAETHLFNTIP